MKKNISIAIIGIILSVCSGIGLKKTFGAETALYYDGAAKEFTYNNLDSEDLFNYFKDLIPGDIRSQNIKIKAHNINTNTKIYLKLNKDDNSRLLNYINVSCYANDVLLSENNDVMLLQNFNNDSEINLKITVEVPIEVGNEIAGLSYSLSWAFLAEENEQPVAESPETGKNTTSKDTIYEKTLLIALFIIGTGALIYGVLKIAKNHKY